MTPTDRLTYCRICEALCGIKVTVEDGVVTRIRPDDEHPVTAGFACPKGIAMTQVQNDPERVVHPLRRTADDTFEQVSWDAAIAEIGDRLSAVRAEHGDRSVGVYIGNPNAFSGASLAWIKGFADALDTPHVYSSGSQDTNSRFVASHFLYGTGYRVPIPDIPRTDLLLMLGANPLVSHGSLVAGGLIRDDLKDVVARGGRVIVVDPRRTETAARYEHVAVRPDGDAWLLLGMLNVIFDEQLEDADAVATARGAEALRAAVAPFAPELCAEGSGVSADTIRALARDLAGAPSAAVYGRVGACLGSFATLVNFLLDALNVVTGNLDRPGGAVFADPPIDLLEAGRRQGLDTYGAKRSRIGDYPDVLGLMPAGIMADEIRTPGQGQLRALFVQAGNPALSVPDSRALDAALGELDLMVAMDLYRNESNSKADFILPATTFLEREDANLFVLQYQYRPYLQWTEAAVAPRGEAREEWTVIRDICARVGLVPSSAPQVRRLGRLGRRVTPAFMFDVMLRTGDHGDRFGLRRKGLNRKKLLEQPRGVQLAPHVPTGVLGKKVVHEDGRVYLGAPEILAEMTRLGTQRDDPEFPMRLFGRRELRSINSWMHNSPKLNPKKLPPGLLMHPHDAEQLGLAAGADVRITSRTGSVVAPLALADEVMPGAVCLPHAWGHSGSGGWTRANETGGANYNVLAAAGPGSLEPLAAMSVLNGVRVRVSAASGDTTRAAGEAVAVGGSS